MPIATLKFKLPEERVEFEDASNGSKYKCQLDEIYTTLFRPRHKHGYPNGRLQELCERPDVDEALDLLERMYRDLVTED